MKLTYPLTNSDEETKLEAKNILLKDLSEISNCNDLSKLHFKYGNNTQPEKAEMQIIDLNEEIKKEVFFLSKNEYSKPILTNQGFIILMVCDRFFPPIDIKDETSIKREIENKLCIESANRVKFGKQRYDKFLENDDRQKILNTDIKLYEDILIAMYDDSIKSISLNDSSNLIEAIRASPVVV